MRRLLIALVLALTVLAPTSGPAMAANVDGPDQQLGSGSWHWTYDDTSSITTSAGTGFQVVQISVTNNDQNANDHFKIQIFDPTTLDGQGNPTMILSVDRPANSGNVTTNVRNNNPKLIAVTTSKGFVTMPYIIEAGFF